MSFIARAAMIYNPRENPYHPKGQRLVAGRVDKFVDRTSEAVQRPERERIAVAEVTDRVCPTRVVRPPGGYLYR